MNRQARTNEAAPQEVTLSRTLSLFTVTMIGAGIFVLTGIVAVVRYRVRRPLRALLIPVAGGCNGRLAANLAASMASLKENGPVKLTLLNVVPLGAGPAVRVRAQQFLDESGPVRSFLRQTVLEPSTKPESSPSNDFT